MQQAKMLAFVPRLLYHPATGYVVLFLSLLLTGMAWHFSVEYSKKRALDRFTFQVEEIESTIRQRMDLYARILQAGVGLFAATETVGREDWRRFVATLDLKQNYPGTQGLGVSIPIKPDELQAHEAMIRAEGFPDYAVRPQGLRDLYTSIVYLEPFDWRNQRAFGFDMYSEPMRRAAMDRAIASGEPTISGKVTLVQETGEDVQAGFLMYAPIYDESMSEDASPAVRKMNFEGFAYAVLRGDDLMQNVLLRIGDDISLQIFDSVANPDSSLYRSRLDETMGQQVTLSSKHVMNIYGRQWVVLVNRSDDLIATGEYRQSTLIGLFGLIIDFLLFYTIHLIGRQRRLADRQRYTEELEQANGELQHMNASLEQSNIRLAQLNDDLQGFAYAASHDLKSPLRSISNLAEFIKEDAGHVLPEASAKHLNLLQSRTNRLTTLLDDLMQYAQVGSTATEATAVDIESLIAEVLELLENPKQFSITTDIDMPHVYTGVVPLRQVFMNLIGNAIKHHDLAEGHIKIQCRYSTDRIECVVSDDGPGIADEYRALVMEMFKTLESRDKLEGSGMGLPLVRKYVESNGGELRFLPNEGDGRGLSVFFSWPATALTEESVQH